MGIYSDGKTYGVNLIIDGESIYKKLYEEPMGKDQIREVKVFFDTITDKNTVTVRFYINACSTFGPGTFMAWYPANLELLEKLFTSCSSLC
jgi:hypothetical protein